jgi:site-specific DNA recombinase
MGSGAFHVFYQRGTGDSAKLAILLGVVDDVRTLRGKFARLAKRIWRHAQTEEGQLVLHNIKTLRKRFEPEVVAKEKASRPRRANVAKGAYRARAIDASWQMPPLH